MVLWGFLPPAEVKTQWGRKKFCVDVTPEKLTWSECRYPCWGLQRLTRWPLLREGSQGHRGIDGFMSRSFPDHIIGHITEVRTVPFILG